MRSTAALFRALLLLACAVVSVAGLVNVYGDNADVMEKAKEVGCPAKSACGMTHMDRTPFSQVFEMRSASGTAVVKCTRSAIFFGDYSCAR